MPPVKAANGRKLYRHKDCLFGAKGGLVYIFDERDGTTTSCTVDEFQARAQALGLEAARCVFPTERDELTKAANDMEEVAAEAAAQGDPTDPHVQAYHARHRSKCGGQILVGVGTGYLGGGAALPPPPSSLLKGGKVLV